MRRTGQHSWVVSVARVWEDRPGRSALVRTVWRAEVEQAGRYPVSGSRFWGLSFARQVDDGARAELTGHGLHARVVDSVVGESHWGVELGPHVAVAGVVDPHV